MRTKETLKNIDDVRILMQYLYMDEEAFIIIDNKLTKLEIKMNESLGTVCKNLSFPHLGFTAYSLELPEWIDIVEYLKQIPSSFKFGNFKTQWEGIKTITLMNLASNLT